MRKLILWNMVTLDGFFDGPEIWSSDWLQYAWGEELEHFSLDQLRSAGMLLFGRVTYEGMAAYWQTATGEVADFMNNLPKVVFTRTLDRAVWNHTKLITTNVASEVKEPKGQATGDIFVFGSAGLSATLIEAGLFDEYRLAIVPVVLGSGNHCSGGICIACG